MKTFMQISLAILFILGMAGCQEASDQAKPDQAWKLKNGVSENEMKTSAAKLLKCSKEKLTIKTEQPNIRKITGCNKDLVYEKSEIGIWVLKTK